MAVRTVTDWRLLGCTHTEIVSAKHLCVSPRTRRIVLVDGLTDPMVWPDSGALTYVPGAVAVDTTTKAWVVGWDGHVRSFTPSTLVELTDTDVGAETADWLAVNAEHIVIAPGRKGGVVTLNASGVVIDECHGVLGAIVTAVYVVASRYLYCFDRYGHGAIVAITAAGVISVVSKFTATNCTAAIRARVNGTTLAVACPDRIVKFSIATADTPSYTSSTRYSFAVRSVCDDTAFTPVGATEQTIFGCPAWSPILEARYTSDGYVLLHTNGSVTLTDATGAFETTATIWDAAHGGGSAVLSASNKTVAIGLGQSIRASVGHGDKKRYFEAAYTVNGGAPQELGVGLALTNLNYTTYLGAGGSDGWGWYETSGAVVFATASTVYAAPGPVVGDVIGVLFDPALGTITWYKNGVSQGVYTHASLIGAVLYPAVGAGSTSANKVTVNIRSNTAAFTYAIPTGAVSWDAF